MSEYDPSKIRIEKRTINGKEYSIKIIPPGMHSENYVPEFNELESFTEDTVTQEIMGTFTNEDQEEIDLVSTYEKLSKN